MVAHSCWLKAKTSGMYNVHDKMGYAFKFISKAVKYGKIVQYVQKIMMGFRYALPLNTQKASH
jgi:hypothetical protein